MIKNIPQVTLNNIDKATYVSQLAEIERQISAYKNVVRFGISNSIRQAFGIDGDCFSIFDKRAGGVLFKDWEWERIPDTNPLKQLFETKKEGQQVYSLDTDEGRILRGADTYYYFLTNKGKSQKLNVEMVCEWAKNNLTFLDKSFDCLSSSKKFDVNSRRLLLGILDNVRNISLIMLNTSIVKQANAKSAILGLTSNANNEEIEKWSEICKNVAKSMKTLCFTRNLDDTFYSNSRQLIDNVRKSLTADMKSVVANPNSINLDKSFRSYREIDNFIENYIALHHALNQIKESKPEVLNRQINFIGATYGGLELPFIANEILDSEILMSAIILQSKYKDRNPNDYLNTHLDTHNLKEKNSQYNILGDDNVLTGKTLQSIINLLFTNDIPVQNITIVRYPSINRVNQMVLEDYAVDTSKFFNYIQGLVFTSPYTKLKDIRSDPYLDELGIFNKDRRRLLEYLYKNGRYTENSEVADIGKMYERR